MGIVVSTHSPTSPFFLTSGIIGFVSFAFTLATFTRVIWTNLETLREAEHEVHANLTNLRTELLEERANLKNMRKGRRKHKRALQKDDGESYVGMELDEVSLKTMGDVIRHLIKQFKELEHPFLAEGEGGIMDFTNHRKRTRRRNSSASPPHYDHAAYGSSPEKEGRRKSSRSQAREDPMEDNSVDEEAFWAQRIHYADFNLRRRLIWLRKKADAQQILESINRLQTRRIARQVGGMAMLMHEYGNETVQLKESVRRIDERVSRVMGVRRVE